MKKILSLLLIVIVFSLVSCGQTTTSSTTKQDTSKVFSTNYTVQEHDTYNFQNPVFGAGADPSIIRAEDGFFYAYPTSATYKWLEEDMPFSSIGPILKSPDLVNWTWVGSVFSKVPSHLDETNGIWAPDIKYFNNQYYYYYTLGIWGEGTNGIGVATSSSPTGPFTDHGLILSDETCYNQCCIDPCVMVDTDGRIYMFYGSFGHGIDVVELTSDGLKVKYPDMEDNNARSIFCGSYEGTYIIKMYGRYYFFGSSGTCCQGLDSTYYVNVYVSDTLLGIYRDKNGRPATIKGTGTLVISPDTGSAKGTGHNAVIQDDDGNYFLVYHAYDAIDNNGQRKLLIDKLLFDEDGFPYVENHTSSLGASAKAPYIKQE